MIESLQNQRVKNWRKFKKRKDREKNRQYLVEGDHLVQEAVKRLPENDIDQIIISESRLDDFNLDSWSKKIVHVTDEVGESLADTETTQGVFAVLNFPSGHMPKKIEKPYVFFDAVQDPGNVGTIIRTAAAAGFEGVVLGTGTVDAYNMKVLRAGQGSHFQMNILEGNLLDFIDYFHEQGSPVFGTAMNASAQNYQSLQASDDPFGLIVGNEGSGISSDILQETDVNLYIPISNKVESLNVSIAAGILIFHLYKKL